MTQDMKDEFGGRLSSEGPLSRICSALILQSPVSTWIADRSGRLVFENAAARHLFNIEDDEDVVGKYCIFEDEALAATGLMPRIRDICENGGSIEVVADYDTTKVRSIRSSQPTHNILRVSVFAVKDDSGRVCNAVIQHEDITDKVQIDRVLSESEARYRQLVEDVSDWVWEVDLEGRYTYSSPVVERILGYRPDEVIGLTAFDLIIPEDRERCSAVFGAAVREKGEITRLLNANRRKDGSICYLETSGKPILDADGRLTGYRGVDRDVTDRVEAERSLEAERERFKALTENATDLVVVLSEDGTVCYASPSVERLLGYTPDEVIGRDVMEFIHPDDAAAARASIDRVAAVEDSRERTQFRIRHKDGTWHYMESLAKGMVNDPVIHGIVVNSRDITERVDAERSLEAERKRFKSLIENATDLITVLDADGTVQYVSPSVRIILGYEPEELIGNNALDYVHPDDREYGWNGITFMVEHEGVPITSEFRLRRKDGEWRTFDAVSRSLLKEPSVHGIVFNHRDITQRMEAERALQESEAEMRALLSAMRDVILVLDSDGRYVSVAPTTPPHLLYRPAEELLGKTLHEVFPKWRADEFLGHIRRALSTGETVSVEYELTIRGHNIWFYAAISPMTNNQVLWVSRDITSLKLTEAKLRMIIGELGTIVSASPIAIIVLDVEERVTSWNPAAERIFGWSAEEVMNALIPIVPHDQRDIYHNVHARLRQGESVPGLELPALRKDGTRICASLSLAPMYDANGNVISILGLVDDITARVTAQKELEESEATFRSLADNAGAVIGIVQGRKFMYINSYFEWMTGYTQDELLSMDISQVVAPDFRQLVVERVGGRQMGLPEPSHYEFKITTKSGKERWLDFSSALITYHGKPAIVGVAYDITERKKMEEALRKSESSLRAIFDNAPAAIITYDQNGVIMQANRGFEKMLGYPAEQVVGRRLVDTFVHAEDRKHTEDMLRRVFSGETVLDVESVGVRPDGTMVYASTSATPIYNDKGEVEMALAVGVDITKRREAEEALKESETLYRLLFESNPLPMWVYEQDTLAFLAVNEAAVQHYGYSREEFLSMTIKDIRPPEDLPTLFDTVHRKKTGVQLTGVWRHLKKNRAVIYVEVTSCPLTFAGRPSVLILANDITERKEAEEALRESEARYRELVETVNVGLAQADADYAFTYVNQGFANMLGRTPEEMIGHSLPEFVHDDYRDIMLRQISERKHGISDKYEMAWQSKDGRKVYALVSSRPILDEEGKFAGSTAVMTDITERVKAEERLRESEERLARILETTPSGTIILDRDGRVTFANEAAERILGLSREQITQRSYDAQDWQMTTVDGRPLPPEELTFARVMRTGEAIYNVETAIKRPDGRTAIVSTNAAPLRGPSGDIVGVVASATDITERRLAQQALEEAESKYRALVEQSLVGVYMIQDERFVYVNPQQAHMLGYPEDELIGKRVIEAVAPESRELVEENIRKRLSGETRSVHYMFKVLRKDGRTADVEVLGSRTMYNGRPAVLGTAMDITERKRTEDALRRSEANFRALFDSMPAAVFAYDRDGIILQANPEFERIFGFKREDVIGRSMFETVASLQERERTFQVIHQVFEGETLENLELEDMRVDGSSIYVLSSTTPVYSPSGDITMALSMGIDITERRLAERRTAELEEHKRDFYRRTILAATEGKLVVTEKDDICRVAGPPIAVWNIETPDDLGRIRQEVASIADADGMSLDRISDFVLTVGEATTNAYKHAGGGKASLHRVDDDLIAVVSDSGKGMEALALPELAFTRGYTTAKSLGMGYKAILSLADKVYLSIGPTGTTVAIQISLQPVGQPPLIMSLPDTW